MSDEELIDDYKIAMSKEKPLVLLNKKRITKREMDALFCMD